MSERMMVHKDGRAIYEIVTEDSFAALSREFKILGVEQKKLCIVTDTNVAPLYLDEVRTQAGQCGAQTDVFMFEAGEENKTLDTVRDLYEFLIQNKYDRKDLLIALGGGVTGDLCGYAAATYLRGIDFVQLPTTLLAQVDSSIGGKTGVDFDSYKNMVGAFHMPRLVYINSGTLLSLPEEQFVSGMGEVVKHGLIKDKAYYDWLWEHREAILARDLSVCREMVRMSDEIKRQIVETDPKEQGERALLNFGHTLGHAIEKTMDFQLLHGHCVAIGSLASAYLSVLRGFLTSPEYEEMKRRFAAFGLPVTLTDVDADTIIRASKNDKKMEAGKIKFILLQGIGQACVDASVTDEEMKLALSAVISK